MLELRVLGMLDLRAADGREVGSLLRQPKRAALLVYLAVARPRGFHRRDALLALFWPELDTARARDALNSALRYLRRGLGPAAVVSRGTEEVGIATGALACDASRFDELVDEGRLEHALGLYHGDLLNGFHVAGAPGFAEWVDRERTRLRERACQAAGVLSERAATTHDMPRAVEWARWAVRVTPENERARRRLIRLLSDAGDRSGALRAYDEFAAWLGAEFGAEPSAATRALVESIRGSAAAARRAEPAQRAPDRPERPKDGDPLVADMTPFGGDGGRAAEKPRSSMAAVAALVGAFVIAALAFVVARVVPERGAMVATRRQITFVGNVTRAAISPDGRRVAYVTQAEQAWHLVVQHVSGGAVDTIRPASRLSAVRTLEWSADGARLLVGGVNRAVVVPHSGGAERAVAVAERIPADIHAYWVPGGDRVSLHQNSDKRVLVVRLDTEDTTSVPVGGDYTWLRAGSWSPNGRLFAVATASSDPLQFAVRTVDDRGRTYVLVEDTVRLDSPRWSPDGDAVYYARGTAAIWRIAVSSRTGRPSGSPELVHDQIEAVADDAGHLGFSLDRAGLRTVYPRGQRYSNLWVVAAQPGGRTPRVRPLTTGTALRWGPAVSPDGRWIAFAQETGDGAELFRMPLEGGAPSQITVGARVRPYSRVAWSPDGRRLAFQSIRAGRSRVWMATLEGGHQAALGRADMSVSSGHLAWAPGALIAYQRLDHRNVSLLDPDSLTERPLVPERTPGWFFSPAYSPDGKQLAVYTYRGPGDAGILVSDLRDTSRTTLIKGGWPIGWSTDARYIYTGRWRMVGRADTRKPAAGEAPLFRAPAREVGCTPAGPLLPDAFVCAAFEFVSDVWMIEVTESRRP